MVNYQYSYLVGGIILLVIWLILFYLRKDVRKEMLFISIIFGIFGPFLNYIYFIDWWHPTTLTNTILSIEDFLYCFTIAGIAAVIYEVVFKKKIRIRKINKIKKQKRNLKIKYLLLLSGLLLLISFYILKFNSLISTIIALFIPTLIIYIKRKDLIIDSIASGFLLLLVAFLGSMVLSIFFPEFVKALYYEHSSKIIIFNVPYWDLFFYFFAGAFIGPLYEYWQEAKLINIKNKNKPK